MLKYISVWVGGGNIFFDFTKTTYTRCCGNYPVRNHIDVDTDWSHYILEHRYNLQGQHILEESKEEVKFKQSSAIFVQQQ